MTRFFIAILPPDKIQTYAIEVVRELGDRYRTSTAKAPPHVTLQPPFEWVQESLPHLEQQLADFVKTRAAFPVLLSGFGAFPPRVLYMNVVKTPGLMVMQAELMAELERSLDIVNPDASHRAFTPHLTVASRNMTQSTFQSAWAELEGRSVEFQFMADALTLLRHDGHRWQEQDQFFLSKNSVST